MYPFREKTPTRRPGRTVCKHYTSYIETLREDFNERCGYCDDSDRLRIRSYTIDHFVPRNPKDFSHNIESNFYYNLVYSCRYCNSAKTNKWPTKDAKIHHNDKEGFIDPIEIDYTGLFKRCIDGHIIPAEEENILANHILSELKLWLPIHERMWKLEKIINLNRQIRIRLNNMENGEIKDQLEKLHYEVYKMMDEIMESIFVENE